jgi:capsular exopolysaccharide synthesis family protein
VTAHPVATEAHFWDYWRVVMRHRFLVLSCFVLAVAAAAAWLVTARPAYTATVTLRIGKDEPRVLKFEEVLRSTSQDEAELQTLYSLLKSRRLARRVITNINLGEHPDFAEGEPTWLNTLQAWTLDGMASLLPRMPDAKPASEVHGSPLDTPLLRSFERRLVAQPVRNARLLNVSFTSHDPDLAARVANTLAETFVAQILEEKTNATLYATGFLSRQLAEARSKLDATEDRLSRFLAANDIVFIDGRSDRPGERQELSTQQLGVISDALLKAQTERITKESLINQALSQGVDAVPVVLQSPLIAKLKEEFVAQQAEYRKLSVTFRPEYPKLQRIQENLAEIRRQTNEEMRRLVAGLEADYRATLRAERELQKVMDQQRGLARKLGTQMAQYNVLRRDVDTNRELYASLLTRLKETQVSSSLLTSNISVVDAADVPTVPSRPRKRLTLLLAAVVGLVAGLGMAFFVDYLDTNFKDPKEVRVALHVPTLGLVPSQGVLEGRRHNGRGYGDTGAFALVTYAESRSIAAESFRKLQTSLFHSVAEGPPRTMLVTSLNGEDGKTSIAANLAITFAQRGAGDILLVDADMRQPDLHAILNVSQVPGLSSLLAGDEALDRAIQSTPISKLHFLPAGQTHGRSAAELLASDRLPEILQELAGRFKHVVIDAPPLFGVSDSMIVAPKVDGVLLVLRQGRATRDAAQEAVELLRSLRARVLGVVLNDVDGRFAGPGYAAYHSY